MSTGDDDDLGLDSAYSLETPDDSRPPPVLFGGRPPRRRAASANGAPFGQNIGRDFKSRMRPPKRFANQCNFSIAKRRAMNT